MRDENGIWNGVDFYGRPGGYMRERTILRAYYGMGILKLNYFEQPFDASNNLLVRITWLG